MTDKGVVRGTQLADYDYDLPRELVASYPTERRDQSKLLVVSKSGKTQRHLMFRDLVSLFRSGDVLVVNETKVIPSRLMGRKSTGARCEVLLLKPWVESCISPLSDSSLDGAESFSEAKVWEALVRPGKKLKIGQIVQIGDDLRVEILDILPGGNRLVRLISEDTPEKALEKHGRMPLPPYLNREEEPLDRDRYQTVYSKKPGSVAAPTAGLHFTPGLLDEIDLKGVQRVPITLNVGVGTFRPVGVAELASHRMHTESYLVPVRTAEVVNKAKSEGRRIWAVGTTVVRALESAEKGGVVRPGPGETDLFIRPPQACIMIDGLITNFHLPRSTLMMLVASFCGYETLRRAYGEAIKKRYRFYSYGDAMAIE